MGALLAVAYGFASYLVFLATFLYAVGFVGNIVVPKSIDAGASSAAGPALALDVALLALFAVQHSVMARRSFKLWLTRLLPPAIERATFVLAASLVLALLFWQWRAIPGAAWTVVDPGARIALRAIAWLGWAMVLGSTFLIDHFELFGLKQVMANLKGRGVPAPGFRTPLLYRFVRHPLYLGFLLAFWSTPTMSVGHLVFATATTGYILLGIAFEERDLLREFGGRYQLYREEVGMLLPRLGKARTRAPAEQ